MHLIIYAPTPIEPSDQSLFCSKRSIIAQVVLIWSSHTRTVVRECCKGDDQSQWRRANFDPRPSLSPLIDLHQNWHRWLRRGYLPPIGDLVHWPLTVTFNLVDRPLTSYVTVAVERREVCCPNFLCTIYTSAVTRLWCHPPYFWLNQRRKHGCQTFWVTVCKTVRRMLADRCLLTCVGYGEATHVSW